MPAPRSMAAVGNTNAHCGQGGRVSWADEGKEGRRGLAGASRPWRLSNWVRDAWGRGALYSSTPTKLFTFIVTRPTVKRVPRPCPEKDGQDECNASPDERRTGTAGS